MRRGRALGSDPALQHVRGQQAGGLDVDGHGARHGLSVDRLAASQQLEVDRGDLVEEFPRPAVVGDQRLDLAGKLLRHVDHDRLLRDLTIDRPDHVWCADITYIAVSAGFLYLVAVMDWASRHVLAWRLSNTMDTGFCIQALEAALGAGTPEIFNTDSENDAAGCSDGLTPTAIEPVRLVGTGRSGGLTRTLTDLVSFPGPVGHWEQPVEVPTSTALVT